MAHFDNSDSNQPGHDAFSVNGDWSATTNRDEPNYDRVAGINDHLHSKSFLSRLREPTTAEDAVWPAIKDILESMGEIIDTLKEVAFPKITPKAVFALSLGYVHLQDGLKFVYAMVALLWEEKFHVIISPKIVN